MHICRERDTGEEEGNSGTSEHDNPVIQRKEKASLLQSRYGYKQVKHSAVRERRREGKQTALCDHVSTLKPQDLPRYRFALDQTAKTTEQWIKFKSYQFFLCRTSNRNCLDETTISEPRHMAFGKTFLQRPAVSLWKLYQPQHDVDDKRGFVEPK